MPAPESRTTVGPVGLAPARRLSSARKPSSSNTTAAAVTEIPRAPAYASTRRFNSGTTRRFNDSRTTDITTNYHYAT